MTADTLGTSLTLDNKLRHQTLMVLTQAGDSAAPCGRGRLGKGLFSHSDPHKM